MGVLDECLHVLEDALERGEAVVSGSIPASVFAAVPRIRPGMSLVDALELVFDEQSALLAIAASEPAGGTGNAMPAAEARQLTARIKAHADGLADLMLEAHDRRAWAALRYRSWERYVKTEFGFSRSRSYEILDQARVQRALRIALGADAVPHIPARTAAAIKPVLGRVSGAIQSRLRLEPADPKAVVGEVIRDTLELLRRGSHTAARQRSEPQTRLASATFDVDKLVAVVDYLADLPSVHVIWPALSDDDLRRLARLSAASHRLSDLATYWERLRLQPTGSREKAPLSNVG